MSHGWWWDYVDIVAHHGAWGPCSGTECLHIADNVDSGVWSPCLTWPHSRSPGCAEPTGVRVPPETTPEACHGIKLKLRLASHATTPVTMSVTRCLVTCHATGTGSVSTFAGSTARGPSQDVHLMQCVQQCDAVCAARPVSTTASVSRCHWPCL